MSETTQRMWAVKSPEGELVGAVYPKHSMVIAQAIDPMEELDTADVLRIWARCEFDGYRCVPVDVVERVKAEE